MDVDLTKYNVATSDLYAYLLNVMDIEIKKQTKECIQKEMGKMQALLGEVPENIRHTWTPLEEKEEDEPKEPKGRKESMESPMQQLKRESHEQINRLEQMLQQHERDIQWILGKRKRNILQDEPKRTERDANRPKETPPLETTDERPVSSERITSLSSPIVCHRLIEEEMTDQLQEQLNALQSYVYEQSMAPQDPDAHSDAHADADKTDAETTTRTRAKTEKPVREAQIVTQKQLKHVVDGMLQMIDLQQQQTAHFSNYFEECIRKVQNELRSEQFQLLANKSSVSSVSTVSSVAIAAEPFKPLASLQQSELFEPSQQGEEQGTQEKRPRAPQIGVLADLIRAELPRPIPPSLLAPKCDTTSWHLSRSEVLSLRVSLLELSRDLQVLQPYKHVFPSEVYTDLLLLISVLTETYEVSVQYENEGIPQNEGIFRLKQKVKEISGIIQRLLGLPKPRNDWHCPNNLQLLHSFAAALREVMNPQEKGDHATANVREIPSAKPKEEQQPLETKELSEKIQTIEQKVQALQQQLQTFQTLQTLLPSKKEEKKEEEPERNNDTERVLLRNKNTLQDKGKPKHLPNHLFNDVSKMQQDIVLSSKALGSPSPIANDPRLSKGAIHRRGSDRRRSTLLPPSLCQETWNPLEPMAAVGSRPSVQLPLPTEGERRRTKKSQHNTVLAKLSNSESEPTLKALPGMDDPLL